MFDALLLVSFGGPEGPDDVVPFLENVTRGRGIPRERLAVVGAHYSLFGGRSPINDQNRALKAALEPAVGLPVVWGNRHWTPYLADAFAELAERGAHRVAAFVTSAYGGVSSCRAYRDAIAGAQGATGIDVVQLPPFFDHPGFVGPLADGLADVAPDVLVLCTAHSVPTAQAAAGPYVAQLEATARLVCGDRPHELVWQSRSGPPTQPWLEPDVCDRLRSLAAEGVREVVLCPIGFVSDHMEVVYDLDTQAAEVAAEVGVALRRSPTPGVHPDFVAMVAELVAEADGGPPRRRLTELPVATPCPVDCCRMPEGAGRPGRP